MDCIYMQSQQIVYYKHQQQNEKQKKKIYVYEIDFWRTFDEWYKCEKKRVKIMQ